LKRIIFTINLLMRQSMKNHTYPQRRHLNLLWYGKRRATKSNICSTINSHRRGAF